MASSRCSKETRVRDIYLDSNATTSAHPDVVRTMAAALRSGPLNPSSPHEHGRRAARIVREARVRVAALVGAEPESTTFLSGATEANHLILHNLLHGAFAGFRLVTTAVEHSAILEAARFLLGRGVPVDILPVSSRGILDLERLDKAVRSPETVVSVQWANNETGVVQPMADIVHIVHGRGAILHTDAVQAAGKVPVSLGVGGATYVVYSGHKIRGPQGIAALAASPDSPTLSSALPGGQQEKGVRPGTENTAAIAGFGVAAKLRTDCMEDWAHSVQRLRDRFEDGLRDLGLIVQVNGGGVPRLPNTSNVQFRTADGEALLLRLSRAGVSCSQGSACRSRTPEPSSVLRAMGLEPGAAWSSLRFSFSEENTMDEVDEVLGVLKDIHEQIDLFFSSAAR